MYYPIKRQPTRIGIYTQKIIAPVFKARGLMEGKIITHWAHIVGDRFARLSLPEKITFSKGKKTEGTLYLSVTSSSSLLLHYAQDLILEQINTFFGYKAVAKLCLTHGFIAPKENPIPPPPPPLSSEEKAWLSEQTKRIEDPDLRACLEKLGESILH